MTTHSSKDTQDWWDDIHSSDDMSLSSDHSGRDSSKHHSKQKHRGRPHSPSPSRYGPDSSSPSTSRGTSSSSSSSTSSSSSGKHKSRHKHHKHHHRDHKKHQHHKHHSHKTAKADKQPTQTPTSSESAKNTDPASKSDPVEVSAESLFQEEYQRSRAENEERAKAILAKAEANPYDLHDYSRLHPQLTAEEEALIAQKRTLTEQYQLRKMFEDRHIAQSRAEGKAVVEAGWVKREGKASLDPGSAAGRGKAPLKTRYGAKFAGFRYVPFDRKRDTETVRDRSEAFEKEGWSALGMSGGFENGIDMLFSSGKIEKSDIR